MTTLLNDIKSREDIELLVTTFYRQLTQDERMAHFFAHIDWVHHLPRMVAFWSFLILNEKGYASNVFEFHRHLQTDELHFEIWLDNFNRTVDSLFAGENANFSKQQAKQIGDGFKFKLKYMRG